MHVELSDEERRRLAAIAEADDPASGVWNAEGLLAKVLLRVINAADREASCQAEQAERG